MWSLNDPQQRNVSVNEGEGSAPSGVAPPDDEHPTNNDDGHRNNEPESLAPPPPRQMLPSCHAKLLSMDCTSGANHNKIRERAYTMFTGLERGSGRLPASGRTPGLGPIFHRPRFVSHVVGQEFFILIGYAKGGPGPDHEGGKTRFLASSTSSSS
ncbi:hypothetical protein BGZ61DRAFT_515090 [Ilyonectria robusta]|uniref:uncharacterized protein n=1 Tax=Ilyonectria robusta TaxID=1079257 RepID=UPI001E8D95B7|nr:uncharacterized protein BGZ61DRAFT_515090 [Ilyonectria robusta]KAH8733868.1 hypothetical protein BGZ61DRAFT_515090 [Ilyonectria robusta]